jgi:hypothetical protein
MFAIVPKPFNALCLFFNGLPLGMVFGLVLGQLEGRRWTEALAAGLCTSFILADGVTKSVGSWLLERQVPEHWMPVAAGGLFLPPLFVCVAMLTRVKPPTRADKDHRCERMTLDRGQRRHLFRSFAVGLVSLIVMYLAVTVVRSMRADFAPELWKGLGVAAPPAIFTQSELYVALIVLAVNGAVVFVRDNALAFRVSLATCILGILLLMASLLAYNFHLLSGFAFMVLIGQGLYLPYVAMHTTVFERLLAMTRHRGNSGFLLYLADSIGYLGYVVVVISKNFIGPPANIFGFFLSLCWLAATVSLISLFISWIYFSSVARRANIDASNFGRDISTPGNH